MRYIKNFENYKNFEFDETGYKNTLEVVEEFSKSYPEFKNFFVDFNKRFKDRTSFDSALIEYFDYSNTSGYDEYIDDEEVILDNITREDEEYMLIQEIGSIIDFDVYVDFFNAIDSVWYNLKHVRNYNI